MDLITELKELGADTAEAVERCMNKPELYEKLLKKVPANLEKLEVLGYLDAGDNAAALANAHTIKGIAGNLSLTPMYGAYTEIVDLLRADKPVEARRVLVGILPVQEKMTDCIKRYC
ncbi:MAG: Hpt domain-containing protein [Oscillospiraceae bacterium]